MSLDHYDLWVSRRDSEKVRKSQPLDLFHGRFWSASAWSPGWSEHTDNSRRSLPRDLNYRPNQSNSEKPGDPHWGTLLRFNVVRPRQYPDLDPVQERSRMALRLESYPGVQSSQWNQLTSKSPLVSLGRVSVLVPRGYFGYYLVRAELLLLMRESGCYFEGRRDG